MILRKKSFKKIANSFRNCVGWGSFLTPDYVLVAQAGATEERVERQVEVIATVPSLSDEPVARFKLTPSLEEAAMTQLGPVRFAMESLLSAIERKYAGWLKRPICCLSQVAASRQ